MLRYIGIFAVFISMCLFGVYLVSRMSQRIKCLQGICEMLAFFKSSISYTMPYLHEMLRDCNIPQTKELTCSMADKLALNEDITFAAEESVCSTKALSVLGNEEKRALITVLSKLGTTDLFDQSEMLENAQKRFSEFLARAAEEKDKNAKVSLTVCIYIGLAFLVMVI